MKFLPFKGPRSYVFVDPDSRYHYTASSHSELVKHILNYRIQNRLEPIESLDAVLENYWCTLPENKGSCKPYVLKRGLLKSIKGGVAVLTNYMFKSFVSQAKADARAGICVSCPHNVDPYKGKLTFWEDKIAEASVGDRRSRYHENLHTCDCCLCPMKVKVFFAEKIELTDEELSCMPDFCWQKLEIQNG